MTDGSIDESFVVFEDEDMYVFNAEHPRPAHAVSGDATELPRD